MNRLAELNVGDNVYWNGEKRAYKVRAKGERYLIVTKLMFGKSFYSIIDTVEGICAPNDLLFNPFDFSKQNDINFALRNLEDGTNKLSRRNTAKITDVIDLERTLNG